MFKNDFNFKGFKLHNDMLDNFFSLKFLILNNMNRT